jgi:hypothetical protein
MYQQTRSCQNFMITTNDMAQIQKPILGIGHWSYKLKYYWYNYSFVHFNIYILDGSIPRI